MEQARKASSYVFCVEFARIIASCSGEGTRRCVQASASASASTSLALLLKRRVRVPSYAQRL